MTGLPASAPRVIAGLDELRGLVGAELAVSPWMEVSAERIAAFADATGDHQWIHLDAAAMTIEGIGMAINYGLNRVRFPAPLRAGRRVRASFVLAEHEPIEGGAQIVLKVTVTEEGAPKPCCVAEVVTRLYASKS